MNRFKNYGLWVSIAAFIPIFLKTIGVDVLPDNFNDLVQSLLGILVVAGIISNPQTVNKGYLDDKTTETTEDKK